MNVHISSSYASIRAFNLYVLMVAAFLIWDDVLAACIAMFRKLHVRVTREIMIPRRFCPLLLRNICTRPACEWLCYDATLFSVLQAGVHVELFALGAPMPFMFNTVLYPARMLLLMTISAQLLWTCCHVLERTHHSVSCRPISVGTVLHRCGNSCKDNQIRMHS